MLQAVLRQLKQALLQSLLQVVLQIFLRALLQTRVARNVCVLNGKNEISRGATKQQESFTKIAPGRSSWRCKGFEI